MIVAVESADVTDGGLDERVGDDRHDLVEGRRIVAIGGGGEGPPTRPTRYFSPGGRPDGPEKVEGQGCEPHTGAASDLVPVLDSLGVLGGDDRGTGFAAFSGDDGTVEGLACGVAGMSGDPVPASGIDA